MALKEVITIVVQTKQAEDDSKKLFDKIKKGGKEATKEANMVAKSFDDIGDSANESSKDIEKYNKAIRRTQKDLADNIKIASGYENAVNDLNTEFQDGIITQKQYQTQLQRLQRDEKETGIETSRLRKQLVGLKRDHKDLAMASSGGGKGMASFGKSTANATPTVIEFSRVIQDAPYGIQGVANNVQQLTTNFGYLSKQAGGALPALKAMAQSFLGPAGIVFLVSVATSLLVEYGNEILNVIKGNNKLAESQKAVSKALSDFYGGTITKANAYVKVLEDVNTTEDERKNITDELIKTIPNLTKADFEYGNNLDVVKSKIGEYVLAQASRIEADTLVQENSEKLAKKARIEQIKNIEDEQKRAEESRKFLESEGERTTKQQFAKGKVGAKGSTTVAKSAQEIRADFEVLANELEEELAPVQERIQELYGSAFEFETPEDKKGGSKSSKSSSSKSSKSRTEDIEAQIEAIIEEERLKSSVELEARAESAQAEIEFEQQQADFLLDIQLDLLAKEKAAKDNAAKEDELRDKLVADAKYNIANRTLGLLSSLATEGSELQKGLAVTQATISGIQGVQNAYTTAQKSPITLGFPAYPTIQAGLAGAFSAFQVGKILSADSSGGASGSFGGGGQGGGGVQAPSFNLVQGTGTNQIAESINNQNQTPLQAFVVSNEITTAQEFDLNVENNASI